MNPSQTLNLEQLVAQAVAAGDKSDHMKLDRLGSEALVLAHQHGQWDLCAKVHGALALSLYRRNELSESLKHATLAKQIGQDHQLPLAMAKGQACCARISWALGDLEEALTELEAAHGPAMASEAFRTQVHVCNLLGLVHADLGRLLISLQFHQDALNAARLAKEPDLELIALTNIAGRWLSIGELAQAEERFDEAAAAFNSVIELATTTEAVALTNDIQMGLPHFLVAYGAALRYLGKTEAALAVFDRLHSIVDQFADRSSLTHAAIQLSAIHRERGSIDEARIALQKGIVVAEKLGAKARLSTLHLAASELEEANGNFRDALNHHKLYSKLREECAIEKAQRKSAVLAVKMETQEALARAEGESLRASQLEAANLALKVKAEHMTREALMDPLTLLGNRRLLDNRLPRMHRRARVELTPLYAAMIDVDHFKFINDRFSHATGDDVLASLGSLIREMSREKDLAVRYGGEEFLVVFQGTNRQTSLAACERFRQTVEKFNWAKLHPELRVSISLGLSNLTEYADFHDGLQSADQLLYTAKANGRNQVCVSGE